MGRYDVYNAQKLPGQTPLAGTPLAAAGLSRPHGIQGITFNDTGDKAYVTCAVGFSIIEVDLESGKLTPYMVYNPENPNQVHLPDDITRVGDVLYYTNLVSYNLAIGNYTKAGGVYKLNLSGPNAFVPQKLWMATEGEAFVNPIEYADGYIYTATTLGFRFNENFEGGSETDPYPHYPQIVFKINASTGELVWKKQYERYIKAFDIRDGWIYAGAARGGGVGDTFSSEGAMYSSFGSLKTIALVRINTETGELQEIIRYPKMQQAYIPEFADKNFGILDNAMMHPDGKHFFISGTEAGLLKMKIQEEQIKPVQ